MIPIYQSNGAWVAVYNKGNVFNIDGEWLGFLVGREVFDPAGLYLGFLSDDRRLLRKRSISNMPPHHTPPAIRPDRPRIPASMPLAPLMRELPHQIIDMFEEYPERLIYISETRPDMEYIASEQEALNERKTWFRIESDTNPVNGARRSEHPGQCPWRPYYAVVR